jgi:nucleotide-binding universal stress UspA family protein
MRQYLVPVDFSKSSIVALDYAIARARRRKAKLILMHMISLGAFATAGAAEDAGAAQLLVQAQEAARKDARISMDKLIARKALAPKEHRVVIVESMNPAGAIAAQAHKSRARMIIMGSEGRTGIQRILAGSVAEATLRATRRPLLIVKRSSRVKAPAKILLVPIDFSSVSLAALKSAREIAKAEREKLLLLDVVTETDQMVPFYLRDNYRRSLIKTERARLAQLAQRLKFAPGAYRVNVIRARDAAAAIVKEAAKCRAAMIVMGSHGRTGLKHLVMGSVAERTLRYARCPVLIVKKPASKER